MIAPGWYRLDQAKPRPAYRPTGARPRSGAREDFVANRARLEPLGPRDNADARTVRNRHGAVRFEHERLGEVLGEVPRRCARVAGQREVRQRGQREVRWAAEAGLEHPAAPPRHAGGRRDIMHAPRLEHPTDAALLDVDDAAGAEIDG